MKYNLHLLSNLTDNEAGINNYAEASLHLAAKVRNRSKQFKTRLTLENPVIQSFLSKVDEPEVEITLAA